MPARARYRRALATVAPRVALALALASCLCSCAAARCSRELSSHGGPDAGANAVTLDDLRARGWDGTVAHGREG